MTPFVCFGEAIHTQGLEIYNQADDCHDICGELPLATISS